MKRKTSFGNKKVDFTKLRKGKIEVSPALAATLRNAVAEDDHQKHNEGRTKFINPHKLEKLSNVISNNINAASDLRAITPYIDKAELIWKTILLNPNGRQERTLSYETENTRFKNSALHNELLAIWEDYFTNDYKIESELGKIISDTLLNTGSYVLFNLSRPGLDYLINGSEFSEGVAGNESLMEVATQQLSKEFEETRDGVLRTVNLGRYVKNPNKNNVSSISGMERLLKGNPYASGELEFNIFEGAEELSKFIDVTLTDNPSILFLQKFQERNNKLAAEAVMGAESLDNVVLNVSKNKRNKKPNKPDATTRSFTEDELAQINETIFADRNVEHRSFQFVKPNDSLSVQPYGRGLTWHCPSESVIPIHYNGSAEKKTDYIVLLDEEGNFLKNTDDFNFYATRSANRDKIKNSNARGSTNSLIDRLRMIQEGRDCDFDLSEFIDIAKDSLIKRFIASIASGKGDSLSVTIDEETNKIFLARIFKKQGVRCLYIPGEAVTYIALKYNNLGIGQSLVQSAKMHIARLAAYDIADTLANLEGSQAHTILNITPEAEDPDPENSIALARDKFFSSNPKLHSLLSNANLSVPQITDALREASLTVRVNSGDNKHVIAPDMSIEPYERQVFRPVDSNSRDQVLNSISNYLHLPRSWIDVSDDSNDFKIEAITEHDMVYNQAVHWQELLCEGISDFQRKHCRVSGYLLSRLAEVIMENKKTWVPDNKERIEGDDNTVVKIILADFLNSVYCELPTPMSVESTNKLSDSIEAVEKLVKIWEEMSGSKVILDKVIRLLGIDDEEYTFDEIKDQIRAVYLTEGMRRYNLPMPFDEIVNEGKGGGVASLVTSITDHSANVGYFLAEYINAKVDSDIKLIKAQKDKLANKIAKMRELGGEEEEEEVMDDTDTSGGEDAPEGGEEGGGDYNPFGDDEGGNEEPAEEGEGEEGSEEDSEEGEEAEESVDEGEGETPPAEEPAGEAEGSEESEDYNPFA